MKKSIKIVLAIFSIVFLGFVVFYTKYQNKPQRELRVLAWVGYDEDDIVKPFEKEFGVKVKTEVFIGGDKMFAKLTQNPDAYDVVVIDPEYIEKLYKAGLLTELNPKDYDFSDYIEPLKHFKLCYINNKMYTVLVRYGINALVYNTQKLTPEDVKSYSILWDPKVRGKVGIWDWYLPNMGVYSLAKNLNPSNPYSLTEKEFDTLQVAMDSLKPQVKAIMGSFSDINAAFVRGDIWIAPALGEHTAAVLAAEGYPVDWVVPKEGGIMWIETLGIPPLSPNKDLAIKYMQYMQRPSTQAKLTWRKAYRSNIPSIEGIKLLSPEQQKMLKVKDAQDGINLVSSVKIRLLPTDTIGTSKELEWQTSWQKFKNGKE